MLTLEDTTYLTLLFQMRAPLRQKSWPARSQQDEKKTNADASTRSLPRMLCNQKLLLKVPLNLWWSTKPNTNDDAVSSRPLVRNLFCSPAATWRAHASLNPTVAELSTTRNDLPLKDEEIGTAFTNQDDLTFTGPLGRLCLPKSPETSAGWGSWRHQSWRVRLIYCGDYRYKPGVL